MNIKLIFGQNLIWLEKVVLTFSHWCFPRCIFSCTTNKKEGPFLPFSCWAEFLRLYSFRRVCSFFCHNISWVLWWLHKSWWYSGPGLAGFYSIDSLTHWGWSRSIEIRWRGSSTCISNSPSCSTQGLFYPGSAPIPSRISFRTLLRLP